MKKICISDITLKKASHEREVELLFREKTAIAACADSLGNDSIELAPIKNLREDTIIYKKETGKSLLKVINEVRIENAVEFLTKGYSVVETAEKVGISESSSFIRLFKKHMGVTPGQIKSRLQNDTNET